MNQESLPAGECPPSSHKPKNFQEQLRLANDRARAERQQRERIADACGLLQECAGYAPGAGGLHIYPGESVALQDERRGAATTLAANAEFCQVWVRTRWTPSIDAVLAVVAPEVVEQFEPHVPKDVRGAQIIEVALRAVHSLYSRLLREPSDAEAVICDLVELRKQLGPNRYVIQPYFSQLAGHVERSLRSPTPALPVLSEDACVFRDILLARGPHDAITGPRLCELFEMRTEKGMDDAEFRTSIVPLLKAWGLKNKRKVGYYFPADAPARRPG